MKLKLILLALLAVALFGAGTLSCKSAPPYIPPAPQNFTGLAWTPSTDPNAVGTHGYFYEPNSTNWTLEFSVLNPTSSVDGVLTNHPSGTAHTIAAFTADGIESVNNPQYTNIVNIAPAGHSALVPK